MPTKTVRAALAALALLGGTALAGKYEDQVRGYLSAISNRMPGSYSRLPDLRDLTTLDDGETRTVSYTLNSGYTYVIAAACDEDCYDLGLELRDENGNLIDSDDDTETPSVSVTPRYRGKFTLKVRMYDCDNDDGCVYGMDVFRK